ncbi:MAG: hypothetical protein ACPLZY_03670 [Candidatus Norongarragalinales archaeon]
MKRVTLIIRQREVSRFFPRGLQLALEDEASLIDAVKAADLEIRRRVGGFPVAGFKGLFQMVYHPYEKRFYRQVAIHAYANSETVNVRENAAAPLPDGTTVILIPEDGCQTDWEEPV